MFSFQQLKVRQILSVYEFGSHLSYLLKGWTNTDWLPKIRITTE